MGLTDAASGKSAGISSMEEHASRTASASLAAVPITPLF
jgi:hypothetical protein